MGGGVGGGRYGGSLRQIVALLAASEREMSFGQLEVTDVLKEGIQYREEMKNLGLKFWQEASNDGCMCVGTLGRCHRWRGVSEC